MNLASPSPSLGYEAYTNNLRIKNKQEKSTDRYNFSFENSKNYDKKNENK